MKTKILLLLMLSLTGCVNSNELPNFSKHPDDNDSTGLTSVRNNSLYSMHDKYHAVTCWYLIDSNNNTTMSCLPDSQIDNPTKE